MLRRGVFERIDSIGYILFRRLAVNIADDSSYLSVLLGRCIGQKRISRSLTTTCGLAIRTSAVPPVLVAGDLTAPDLADLAVILADAAELLAIMSSSSSFVLTCSALTCWISYTSNVRRSSVEISIWSIDSPIRACCCSVALTSN